MKKLEISGTLSLLPQKERCFLIVEGLVQGFATLVSVEDVKGRVRTVMCCENKSLGNFLLLDEDIRLLIDEGILEFHRYQ